MERVEFTKEMKQTHKILIPAMLPIHFELLAGVLRQEGYQVELLKNEHDQIIEEGLSHVHNDTCYPALLVIGQMIDALKSGKYDVDHVALAITQTGGGCRASNYIHLLRKALVQAGYEQVPVISVNFSKLEKNSGFQLNLKLIVKLLYAFLYGDALMWIANQCKPYEVTPNNTNDVTNKWIQLLIAQFQKGQFLNINRNMAQILTDYHAIAKTQEKKIKVGIVGEIYMKYAPLGNNHLEDYILKENGEPVVSGALDFGLYCLENSVIDNQYYHKNIKSALVCKTAEKMIILLQRKVNKAIQKHNVFRIMEDFEQVKKEGAAFIDKGVKMGEGWLLTSEMIALINSGVNNIVCTQPFGCLPNHIVAKGMIRKIRTHYPNANIVAIDYDPSATKINQENRLKLMLATAQLNAESEN